MAKLLVTSFQLLRRSYTVEAETVRMQLAAAVRKVGDLSASKQKEIYWMKDPKTGNWIPETHFDEVDSADLRNKLLPKKEKL